MKLPVTHPRAFTLIELLITITLLGLMVFSVIGGGARYRTLAQDSRRKADLERLKTALYDYYFDVGCFPETIPSCGQPLAGSGDQAYLGTIPCDPKKNDDYRYEVGGEESCRSWFKVLTNLNNAKDPSIDEVHCRTGCGESCDYNYGLSSTNTTVQSGCVKYFVCSPGGACEDYEDPAKSKCPVVFENDPVCGGVDCGDSDNRCKNASGKKVPD